ncbi:MAG: enoyl-CoA hydratase-related protein [Arenicella sp.]|jgi:2-(1,2-epoxy-1,2-dihydrophenyl)acetyl-CoA isomerase|nr:enoyl-CoA hydratase-related protein [Arenicella sp.]
MAYQTIGLAVSASVATLTLNRPDAANGMNLQLMKELVDAVHSCEEDPQVRAIIITGAGRFFSAGGDLAAFSADLDRLPRLLSELTLYLHTAISRLARMNRPVIAAINGPCAGAGLSLACACDLVLAAQSSNFTMAYTAAGLSPDGGSTWFIPRRIGDLRTRELMLTNRKLSAEEALQWGLVTRVIADEMLLVEARKLAECLAAGPTVAYGNVKALLNDTFARGMETQMEFESRAIASSAKTADAREGVSAFLKKVKANFNGS